MLASYLATILTRDLRALRREVEAYPDDASLWRSVPSIPNAGGTLVLHLAGNLQHFIGAELGKSGYVRDRKRSFQNEMYLELDLLREIDAAEEAVANTVPRLTGADLDAMYPSPIAQRRVQTDDMLLHLATHLAYHLGQIDYHRRAVVGDAKAVGAVSPAELHSAIPA